MVTPFGEKNTEHCKRHFENPHLRYKREVQWYKTILKIAPKKCAEIKLNMIKRYDRFSVNTCNRIGMRFKLMGEFGQFNTNAYVKSLLSNALFVEELRLII